MNLKKIVSRNNFFKEYISVLNGMLQLSKREAEVFSFLLAADLAGFADNVNCKTVRKIIISQLGISKANLSKYLNTIKAKDLIVRGENGKWILNDDVRIKPVENSVYITIILEYISNSCLAC